MSLRFEQRSKQRSRREFLAASAGTVMASAVPQTLVQANPPPNERVNIAAIGAGGMGGGDIATLARLGANIVAVCDVDDERALGTYRAFPNARRYKDFRTMLEREARNIDAVTVGTPDHTHAVATMAAIRAGKHVFCQKPLTRTLHECREVTRAARAAGVATQMGNQGHATEGARLTNEWIRAGVIGTVREVHAWSDRAGRLWRQGIGRPSATPPVPQFLDWDLWLGPSPTRPYNPAYVPANWRGWWDFGTGALGDMGCHILDHPVWALELGAPAAVEARTTLDGSVLENNRPNAESFPIASIIYFDFPARGQRPPVRLTWYDGGLMPPRPADMPASQRLPDNGVLYVGSSGVIYHSSHGGMPQILPVERLRVAQAVPRTMPRSPGHYEEWLAACREGAPAASNFTYAGPLTEIVLLGVLSLRAPGQRLEWDAENLRIRNTRELDPFVRTEHRGGWSL
jgi:predicted dehydrogenase